jgi:hypothetical protein
MVKQMKVATGPLVIALLALMILAQAAYAQARSPIEIVQALADAENRNDPVAMRAVLAPNALLVNDPGTGGPIQGREQWIFYNTGTNNAHVTPSNIKQTAPDTVTADAVLSGGDVPAQLAHPFLVHVTFTVSNGQISHGVIITDPQTLQDLQALSGPAPSSGSSAETPSPVDVVLALADAQNQNNPAAMRALLAPNALIHQDPLFGGSENREQFITGNTGANNSIVSVNNLQQIGSDTVKADAILSGGQIPPSLPHPFLLHVVFTVVNGQVTHAVVNLDAQTRKDLEALGPPPGMPRTGQSADWVLPPGLAVAVAAAGIALCGVALALRTRRRAR